MKKQIFGMLVLLFALITVSAAGYADQQYGVLKIIANQETAKIYVDGNYEGTGTVSREKIIVGNHLVQVKDKDKNVIFEEMVSVRDGEQTTVVAKIGEEPEKITEPSQQNSGTQNETSATPTFQPPKFKNLFGINASYGNWSVNVAGYTSQSPEPVKEIGLHLKTLYENNAYIKSSFHYILPVSGGNSNIGSFLGLDFGGQSDLLDGSIGLNYFLPNLSGMGATGGLGYQAAVGMRIAGVTVGAKYLILNGTLNSGYYSTGFSYSQILLSLSADFGG